jgi:histidinol dehydrogenase
MKTYFTTGPEAPKAERALRALESRASTQSPSVLRTVRSILASVRRNGDAALRRYAARFDALPSTTPFRVTPDEMSAAWHSLPAPQKAALRLAISRIRSFARRQRPREFSSARAGLTTGQILRPLDAVACYVPSGRHPLPSTLLMTVIPAQVAGVPRIAVLCPRPEPIILAAAHSLAVTEFYRIGGAQAIAALAYGTRSIPRVDKIIGPGNAFVTAAKQIVASDPLTRTTIDMAAGPTETLIASTSGNPLFIAADLVAQAEHDPDALPIFVTTSRALATKVRNHALSLAKNNPTAFSSLTRNGAIFIARNRDQLAAIVNRIAPEHLTLDVGSDSNSAPVLSSIRNAGSIFIGTETPQPLGDYLSGPNHTLPTLGLARQRGGLSVTDFLKVITVQHATPAALRKLSPAAITLAEAEGLTAHADALRLRLDNRRLDKKPRLNKNRLSKSKVTP